MRDSVGYGDMNAVAAAISGATAVLSVASWPRFGGYSQARTLQLVWASWRETQLGRNQLDRDQLDRDQLFAPDRFSTDRVFLCV